jgi:hypothetical protein
MGAVARTAACVAVLAGPAVLAFASGGYFDRTRLWAGIAACALVVAAAAVVPSPLPRARSGRVAVAGLAALTAWTGLSLLWAPLGAPAAADFQRALLYLAALVAAAAWLRGPRASAAAEPALAAGIVAVVAYGLGERVLPGVLEYARSPAAGGRLNQPVTYWNGMGALAAIGLALSAGIVAEADRRPAVRALAAAAAGPLGAGIALSFSRGALLAAAVGALAALATRPTRGQLAGFGVVGAAAAVAGIVAAVLPVASSLEGSPSGATRDGAILGVTLLAVGAAAAFAQHRLPRRAGALPGALGDRRLFAGAAAVLAVGVVGVVLAQDGGEARPAFGADAGRLGSVETNRGAYWRVAAATAAEHPLTGTGAGGWRVEWLRERRIAEAAKDAHSLPLETAAELGIVGLAALLALLGGVAGSVAAAVRVALQRRRGSGDGDTPPPERARRSTRGGSRGRQSEPAGRRTPGASARRPRGSAAETAIGRRRPQPGRRACLGGRRGRAGGLDHFGGRRRPQRGRRACLGGRRGRAGGVDGFGGRRLDVGAAGRDALRRRARGSGDRGRRARAGPARARAPQYGQGAPGASPSRSAARRRPARISSLIATLRANHGSSASCAPTFAARSRGCHRPATRSYSARDPVRPR